MAEKNVGGRDRLVRTVLAVVLSVVAVSILKDGSRKTGLLAGIGALTSGEGDTTDVFAPSFSVLVVGAGTAGFTSVHTVF